MMMWLVAALLVTSFAATSSTSDQELARPEWSAEIVAVADHLPVQDDGRVKPLKTFAMFEILQMRGLRRAKTARGDDGAYLAPSAWFLDCLFYPEVAKTYPVFLVENAEVLGAMGIADEVRKERDRYSYNELKPGFEKLSDLAERYSTIQFKDKTPVQRQVARLVRNLVQFRALASFLDYARERYKVDGSDRLKELFGGKETVRYSEVLRHARVLKEIWLGQWKEGDPKGYPATPEGRLFESVAHYTQLSRVPSFVPPKGVDVVEWLSLSDVFEAQLRADAPPTAKQLEVCARFERLLDARDDRMVFLTELTDLCTSLQGMAEERGEYGTVPAEVIYYNFKFLDWSQYTFLLGFVLLAFLWMAPRNRVLAKAVPLAGLVGLAALITAITFRCYIRSRPPISTLYETILFITAINVGVLLLVELVSRRRVALSIAIVLGVLGIFMADRWELHDGRDTMPTLQAVLDTNFWLATHVTCITTGYAASLMAAALANFWILGNLVAAVRALRGGPKPDDEFWRNVARMVYGAVCFGLLFSLVGTILGGVWANDSWGRFWGWDPKENGALMICLMQLALLHARMGGLIKHLGLAIGSVGLGVVTAFSWWHVNQFDIGLHSYGPAPGILRNLFTFYGIESVVLLGGVGVWLLKPAVRRLRLSH